MLLPLIMLSWEDLRSMLFRQWFLHITKNLKFPVESSIGEVWGDQFSARKCYVEMIRVDRRQSWDSQNKYSWQSVEVQVLEEIPLSESFREEQESISIILEQPHKTIKVAADLPEDMKSRSISWLIKNKDIFAWSELEVQGGFATCNGASSQHTTECLAN